MAVKHNTWGYLAEAIGAVLTCVYAEDVLFSLSYYFTCESAFYKLLCPFQWGTKEGIIKKMSPSERLTNSNREL